MDLNQELIKHPISTLYLRATGISMAGSGSYPGDLLIMGHSLEPTDKKVIIAVVNGELAVKRIKLKGNCVTGVSNAIQLLKIST